VSERSPEYEYDTEGGFIPLWVWINQPGSRAALPMGDRPSFHPQLETNFRHSTGEVRLQIRGSLSREMLARFPVYPLPFPDCLPALLQRQSH
jgi:hypothetical protein